MERNTRQRNAIRDAIVQADRPLLPQEVLDAAQHAVPGLGITTVYRTLKLLVEEGELQAVNLPGENPRFEAVGHPGRSVAPGAAGLHGRGPRPNALRTLQRLCAADSYGPTPSVQVADSPSPTGLTAWRLAIRAATDRGAGLWATGLT